MENTKPVNIPKPITMVHAEFMSELVRVVNESQLPFFIIENSLKEFIGELHEASVKQLDADKMKYNQQLTLAQASSSEQEDDVE